MSLILRGLIVGSTFLIGVPVNSQPFPDLAHSSIEELSDLARKGHKPAQLELGKKLEAEGKLKPALKWYSEAGRDVKSKSYVYSPPVGNEAYGRVIENSGDHVVPGLQEARERAYRIRGKIDERSK